MEGQQGSAVRRARWRSVLVGIAIVIAALAAAAYAALHSIQHGALKARLERQLSSAVAGEVRLGALDVRVLPRPGVDVSDFAVHIPGVVEAIAPLAGIDLAWGGLLSGDIRASKVRLERPEVVVHLRVVRPAYDEGTRMHRHKLRPTLREIAARVGDLGLVVSGGTLRFLRGGDHLGALTDLSADLDLDESGLALDARSGGDLWRKATAALRVPVDAPSKLELQVSGLDVRALAARFVPDAPVQARAAPADVRVAATLDADERLRAEVSADAAEAVFERNGRALRMAPLRVRATVERQGDALTLTATRLAGFDWAQDLQFSFATDAARAVVGARAASVDLQRLREDALAFAGDIDGVRTAAQWVGRGTLAQFTLDAEADTVANLADATRFRAGGNLTGGTIGIPPAAIELVDASGRLGYDRGALRVDEAAFDIGRSRVQRGSTAMTVWPAFTMHELDAQVDVELADALARVRAMPFAADTRAALARIESLHGRLEGGLKVAQRASGMEWALDARALQAALRHADVPLPIEISAGRLAHAADEWRIAGLRGRIGASTFERAALRITTGRPARLASGSASADLALEELHGWLGGGSPALKRLTGRAQVELASVQGPLASPQALRIDATVQPRDVQAVLEGLPGPLALNGGTLRAVDDRLVLENLGATLLDTNAALTGAVETYASPARRVRLSTVRGTAGAKTVAWASDRAAIPERARLRAPVAFDLDQLEASGDGATVAVRGTAQFPNQARASFSVNATPRVIDVPVLTLRHAATDATLAFRHAGRALAASFRGSVSGATVAGLVQGPLNAEGQLDGDFRIALDLDHTSGATATGTLSGKAVEIPLQDSTLVLEHIALTAVDDGLTIDKSAIAYAGERVSLTGSVRRTGDRFRVDAKVTADVLDVDRLRTQLAAQQRAANAGAGPASWPIDGRVAIDLGRLRIERLDITPFVGQVEFARGESLLTTTDTRLCGVSAPVRARLANGKVDASMAISARGLPLAETVLCLTGGEVRATGALDVNGSFAASGAPGSLRNTATGRFDITMRKGVIQSAPIFARLLDMIALLQLYPAALASRGTPYDEIRIVGTLDKNRVRMERGTMTGPAIGASWRGEFNADGSDLDMRGLIAPLGNVDRVLSWIPIVGRLIGTHVLAVPFGVRGSLAAPEVLPLQPGARFDALSDDLESTLRLPARLFSPMRDILPR
jgi:hypothetical protein